MSLLMLMLLIFVAGAMGGAINALLSDNGFLMPKWEMVGGNKIFRLGFFGNIFISGVGACRLDPLRPGRCDTCGHSRREVGYQ